MNQLIVTRKVIFYVGVVCLVWFLAEKAFEFNLSGSLPLAFVAVFLYGAHIVLQYATSDIIDIGPGWSVPAGDNSSKERKFGAAVGIFICVLTVYGYFAGWSS